jgi:hypothetical protein
MAGADRNKLDTALRIPAAAASRAPTTVADRAEVSRDGPSGCGARAGGGGGRG